MVNGEMGAQERLGGSVGIVTKVDRILRLLEGAPDGVGLSELSRRTGIKKATCYRIVSALEDFGYVTRVDGGRQYRLGLRLLELGTKAKAGLDLRRVALPVMNWLAEETEETVFLCIRKGRDALCVERIDGRHVQVMALQVGGTQPLYLGGAPRCLLASLSDEEIHQVLTGEPKRYTEYSPRTWDEVWQLVRATREQGYSLSVEDVVVGVCAIGAPIYDLDGKVVASVSVAGIVQRVGGERLETMVRLVKEAGRRISARLGYRDRQEAEESTV